ncbi:cation diffusion facilitator family transporter [Halopseudomonas salegens]|uniref:Cation diffusion facilitator family transporter n=1 Tax=Halopseudomonas salegens TaxID=1434072 RepID=A0A1H2GMZ6_9GAMM|nr:cation diffusion facilitator family transporter [Halopseudomonas salegens]SDU20990.1 cation diffusion facilitator family transporter [Halopseudomonas salegens]
MRSKPLVLAPAERQRHMQRVTWISTLVDFLLSVVKLVIGFWVRSPALIADGIHSLSDLLTDGFVLAINRISHAEPDNDHPYGHARFETVGTVLLGAVLLLVGAGLGWDNINRLIGNAPVAEASTWAIAAAVLSLLSKELLYRYGLHWAEKLDSDLLKANAWHSRSDALSSLVVLFGVLATWFGYAWIESWAALLVAALIGQMGAVLGWNALQQLADRGLDEDRQAAIRNSIMQVPGVVSVHALRSRHMGNEYFIDVHIQVGNYISVSEGHQISDWVMRRLMREFSRLGDITLHIDPEDDETPVNHTLAPLRPDILAALAAYPALADSARVQIHYHRQQVLLELFFTRTPDAACQHEAAQAIAELEWLAAIELHQIHVAAR